LINISNDAWFGASAALAQHLGAARLRAVELRRYLVRATNTGLSAIVAPTGSLTAELAPNEPGVASAEVEAISWRTPYARLGDVFAWACAFLVAIDWLRRQR
jgi:apolipoprotein N-acyltransferase